MQSALSDAVSQYEVYRRAIDGFPAPKAASSRLRRSTVHTTEGQKEANSQIGIKPFYEEQSYKLKLYNSGGRI